MRYRADFHIHSDILRNHGEKPERIAKAAYESGLDVIGVLEHNIISNRASRVREEIAELAENDQVRRGVARDIITCLGVEVTLNFHGFNYHLGYIFSDQYQDGNLPTPPPFPSSVTEIEQYKKEFPGICIFFHPAWRDHKRGSCKSTESLMQSGIFDGVEILNGSIIDNISRRSNGRKAAEVKQSFWNCNDALAAFRRTKTSNGDSTRKIAPIGSSDAHRAHMIGTICTEYTGECKEDVFTEIRKGRTKVICATNGDIRKKVKALLRDNGAGHYIRILKKA